MKKDLEQKPTSKTSQHTTLTEQVKQFTRGPRKTQQKCKGTALAAKLTLSGVELPTLGRRHSFLDIVRRGCPSQSTASERPRSSASSSIFLVCCTLTEGQAHGLCTSQVTRFEHAKLLEKVRDCTRRDDFGCGHIQVSTHNGNTKRDGALIPTSGRLAWSLQRHRLRKVGGEVVGCFNGRSLPAWLHFFRHIHRPPWQRPEPRPFALDEGGLALGGHVFDTQDHLNTKGRRCS